MSKYAQYHPHTCDAQHRNMFTQLKRNWESIQNDPQMHGYIIPIMEAVSIWFDNLTISQEEIPQHNVPQQEIQAASPPASFGSKLDTVQQLAHTNLEQINRFFQLMDFNLKTEKIEISTDTSGRTTVTCKHPNCLANRLNRLNDRFICATPLHMPCKCYHLCPLQNRLK